MRAALVLAAMGHPGCGLRKTYQRANMMTIAGVPMHNFGLRHLQSDGVGEQFEWVLILQEGSTVDSFCSVETCKTRGHTGGVPFVSVVATTTELTKMLEVHSAEVVSAEPDIKVYIPDDIVSPESSGPASASSPWHLDRVGRSRSSFTGKGVHIYVMDTGVRSTHVDFGGRAIPTLDTLAGNGVPVECNGDPTCATDYHGHGTHVASSAGGTNYGIAPESTIHIMKVCCGRGTNTLAGMDYIVQNANRPAIMTVSLASQGRSESARQAVDRVVGAGVTVTVGAANDDVDTCTMTYGFIPSAISVGATDSNDRRAVFSNWGSCNDIYAPGVAIFGAWNTGDEDTRAISGTSMATPVVAGAAALLLEQDPARSPQKVLDELLSMSIRGVITDLQPGDPDMLVSVVP